MTLRFLAPSGAPSTLTEIRQLDPPGNTSGAHFIGFFGAGGPQGSPFAIIVDRFQDRTFITNSFGNNLGLHPYGVTASGELINHKYISSNTVNVSGLGVTSLTNVTRESGTLLVRFNSPGMTNVVTQNAILYAVDLNASSGVNNVLNVPTNIKIFAYEVGVNPTWTQIAGVGAVDNRLLLLDHNVSDVTHDFFIGLSISPETMGQRNNIGYLFNLEFL